MKRLARFLTLTAAMFAGIALTLVLWKVERVSGAVRDQHGRAVAGATVRIRASGHMTQTDSQGHFTLTGFPPNLRIRVTAWADGYYVAGRTVWPWIGEVALTLLPYAVSDNVNYEWITPVVKGRSAWEALIVRSRLDPMAILAPDALFFKAAEGLALGCQDCHSTLYDQWEQSAHAIGISNPRFASIYNGTDLSGENHSPPTRMGFSRNYGRYPLPPDPTQSYYGPGYKLDFPDTAGNCAACHLPAAALHAPYETDPNRVTGVNALGTHCDFCHKIAEVRLDPETGLPNQNMPGVLSLVMMRPSAQKQIFFGPYDDVDAGVDTYLPLLRKSEFCAPCHSGNFWGIPIYESFAEWKASPYSDPDRAAAAGLSSPKSCQDCHMKPDGITTNFAPNRAGQERDPATIFSHAFPGAADEALLQNAVSMTARARRAGDRIIVQVTLFNDQTGHHVPTDSPLRQMILLVRAADAQGKPLALLDGPTVPEWGGVGDPNDGYYAGMPGEIYSKVLMDLWTEAAPTGAYWIPTRVVNDNRIPALGSATSSYVFHASDATQSHEVSVIVTLLFRRAFIQLMDQKNWEVPDILMERAKLLLP